MRTAASEALEAEVGDLAAAASAAFMAVEAVSMAVEAVSMAVEAVAMAVEAVSMAVEAVAVGKISIRQQWCLRFVADNWYISRREV